MSDYSQFLYAGEAEQVDPRSNNYMEIDPQNWLYGASAGLLFFYGLAIYQWYPGFVRGDAVKYPERTSNSCLTTQEWALQTSEVRAWSNAGMWHIVAYGWTFFIWAWNSLAGNNGGYKHQAFYQTSRVMALGPLVSLFSALGVAKSYAPTSSAYQADIAYWGACQYTWLFDPDQTVETSPSFMEDNQQLRQWGIWLGAGLALVANSLTMTAYKEDYEEAKLWWDAEQLAKEQSQ